MPKLNSFIKNIINKRPIDAAADFDEIMNGVLADKLEAGYELYKQDFFGDNDSDEDDSDYEEELTDQEESGEEDE